MKKSTVLFLSLLVFVVLISCGKKTNPGGPLDVYNTPTPTMTPNITFGIQIVDVAVAAPGVIVALREQGATTWITATTQENGIASFEEINAAGIYEIHIDAVDCFNPIDITKTVSNNYVYTIERGAQELSMTLDSGINTWSIEPKTLTYTVKYITGMNKTINNFNIVGLPAGVTASFSDIEPTVVSNNDSFKVYLNIPAQYSDVESFNFYLTAKNANCPITEQYQTNTIHLSKVWALSYSISLRTGRYHDPDDRYFWGYRNSSLNYSGFTPYNGVTVSVVDFVLQNVNCSGCNNPSDWYNQKTPDINFYANQIDIWERVHKLYNNGQTPNTPNYGITFRITDGKYLDKTFTLINYGDGPCANIGNYCFQEASLTKTY